MTREQVNLTITIIMAAICIALTVSPGAGFMLLFVVVPLLFWIPYAIRAAITVPETRRMQTARILIWLGAVSLVGGIHYVRAEAVRHNANEIVAKIDAFNSSHGHCAANVAELGLSEAELKERLGTRAFYFCENGKQVFLYAGTFEIATTYSYDFESHTWEYNPG